MNKNLFRTARPEAKLKSGDIQWYRISNVTSTEATIHLYDEIGYFGVTAADFIKELGALSVKNITLHINSPGGDVFDGVAIYNAVKSHPANVTVSIDGLAASAASFIAMAGNTVEIARNATVMIHDAHTVAIGNASEMKAAAELLNQVSDNIADIYTQKAGGSVESWRAVMKTEKWYSAQEAKDAGLVDTIQSTESVSENSFDLSIFAKYTAQKIEIDLQAVTVSAIVDTEGAGKTYAPDFAIIAAQLKGIRK